MRRNGRAGGLRGHGLWQKWIERNDLTYREAGALVEVSEWAAFSWAHPDYERVPDLWHREAIEIVTGGKVPARSWGQMTRLSELRPYVPAA